jgi:hypothetical protein
MERDSILSHGMSSFMYDSMMVRGDYYKMAICNHSGTIAIYNRATQNFYSPMVDGPLQFEAVDAETLVPSTVSKYGKEFSIVEVPYCLKLLIHELTAMNVQMRLITADTVECLTTAGKRSLGSFQEWIQKEVPNTVLEKEKIEKLLNQTLSEEEFKAITEPSPVLPNLNLQEPINESPAKIPENKPNVQEPASVPILKNTNGLSLNETPDKMAPVVNTPAQAPTEEQPNLSLNNSQPKKSINLNETGTPVESNQNQSSNQSTNDSSNQSNQSNESSNDSSNQSSNESIESNGSNEPVKESTTKKVVFAKS